MDFVNGIVVIYSCLLIARCYLVSYWSWENTVVDHEVKSYLGEETTLPSFIAWFLGRENNKLAPLCLVVPLFGAFLYNTVGGAQLSRAKATAIFAMELVTLLIGVYLLDSMDFSTFCCFFLLVMSGAVLVFTDLENQTLPDEWIGLICICGLVGATQDMTGIVAKEAVIGAIIAFVFLYVLRVVYSAFIGSEALGLGDVKLMASLCLFVEITSFPYLLTVSAFAFVIYGLIYKAINDVTDRMLHIAFGPFLILAAFSEIFLGGSAYI